MIVKISKDSLPYEVFQIKLDAGEAKTKSLPPQELTDEFFIKQVIFDNDKIVFGTGIDKNDLLEVTLKELN